MLRYFDINGNPIPSWPTIDNDDARRIGSDNIGDVKISTVHLVLDHQLSNKLAPLIFETMIFGGEYDEWQCRWATKKRAEIGHKATLAWLLSEGPEPKGDYAMTLEQWQSEL